MTRFLGTIVILGLIALAAPAAWAHKGKLPDDALTLVRQASALLAQNPGMTGEVRERVQAALRSKQTTGVHMDQVAAALRALEGKDLAAARRLLTESIMPTGMPMPPSGPRRAAAPPPLAAAPVPMDPTAPPGEMVSPGAPPTVETAMKMAEPLRPRFSGSTVEVGLVILGAFMVGSGLLSLRRGQEMGR